MVSTLTLEEKFKKVRKNFCFYLDIQDHGLARSISRRIQDMGLQQDVFLTSRVTHVVSSEGRRGATRAQAQAQAAPCARGDRRADAMLQRVAPEPQPDTVLAPHATRYVQLTVQKAISLLDKLYDTFFAAPRKAHIRFFTKHFIKIEFLDKVCRPLHKEFDEWPEISFEPDPPRDKREKKESRDDPLANLNRSNATGQKMTRKSRPRIKEKEEKEQKGGYCEMCNSEYTDAALHRRSPQHLSFVRDHANFLALDSLISAGADVATFLDRAAVAVAPLNGERRSLRHLCNGDDTRATPDSLYGDRSPRRNGQLDDERRHSARATKRADDDRHYYRVVGVSTKLRSSGGFAKRKESPPACNGAKPLVVKFRKVRRSELSVLSDEAEQFMFPKRASSTSSTSSDEEEKEVRGAKRKSPAPPPPPPAPLAERRRLARPLALKEESSEEDSWPEDKRRRKRRPVPVAKRARRTPGPRTQTEAPMPPPPPEEKPPEPVPKAEPEVSPLREEPVERCMKWEDGRLKYTPAVEQLEFAFESVPASEPWFETFRRQDQDKVVVKNIPQYFELYCKAAPKLPYEIGQLPPLKPNCCPLSDLVVSKKEEKAGPSRSYGTRGMKKQRIRKRTAAILALEGHPRKSPREHASTLAILGSAGLLHRRKHVDDAKSTASEDTISDTHSNLKIEPVVSETQVASERLQQFLSEVFEDAAEFDMSDEVLEGDAAIITSTTVPDVSSLVSECEDCDIIRNEIKLGATERGRGRRGKFKKKNRTGWPNKKKVKKGSRTNSLESERKASGPERSSAEPPDDDTTQSTISEDDANLSEAEKTVIEKPADETLNGHLDEEAEKPEPTDEEVDLKEDVQLDVKVVVQDEKAKPPEKDDKRRSRSSMSEEEKEIRKKKRALQGLLLQPVVRVARVDAASRRLRSNRGRARR
ncbi:hypothetical protein evm_012382 [Chilo suppressalis]|nr:hypothetical protein evm_012382 [Chilo suppressalis]